jgi:tetratricopeptide (TPR) repeat protein
MNSLNIDDLVTQVEQALAQSDVARAIELVAPFRNRLEHDAALAKLWLTLLRIQPSREGLQSEVERIAKRWPDEAALQLAACDALIRAAELVGPDMPVPSDGAADRAVNLAETNLNRLALPQRKQAATGGYWWMNLANALRLSHRYAEAADAYAQALELDPNNGDWWFNAGLLHKAQGNFEQGLAAAERARELLGDRRGVLWNIALCGTALGQGAVAVTALR